MFVEDAVVSSEELELLRAQLLQAQRLSSVGALASSVAHELNNILTVILNNAKFGLRAKAKDTDRVESLEKILKSGERAGLIIRSMLGVARNKSSAPTIVDIVDLVEEVLVLTGEDLSRYRVHVQKKFVGRPQVKGILSQLEQVLINLILNARQAIGEGGHLCIEVGIGGESMVEIRISDDGCGIPTEKLRHIFEPFFTTKDPDEDGHGGTGLGLSICRQIIERHQGRIRVESLVNQGTTFIIKLPVYIP